MADPLRLDPAFAAAVDRLHETFAEAYRRAAYIQARMFEDTFAGRPTREIRDYLADAGIDVDAEARAAESHPTTDRR